MLKATHKKPVKSRVGEDEESKRKKAILDGVKRSSDSIKATLQAFGLPQSTYYGWLKRYEAKGLDGLKTGNPVSDELWQRFIRFKKKQKKLADKSKLTMEETQTMKSEQDKEKIKKLLFKRFDEKPSKQPERAVPPEAEPTVQAGKPKTVKEPPPPPQEPMDKTVKYAVGALAFVIAILLLASLSNSNKFYFKQSDQMVEVWQGRFAPMGEHLVASFSDPKILEAAPEQEAYTKKQAFGILSGYFIKRADELLNTGETPDLKTVKSYLTHASKYALSQSEQQAIRMRLNSIEFLVLLGKADLALNKGTVPEFEAAKGYLAQAVPLASTDLQKDVLMKRLAAVEYALATIKISKGEKQLADLYREALNRHLQKAKEYSPEKAQEIDLAIGKIKKWLDEFDKKHVGVTR
ncbi:MAG: helix-turn-helix domain-containing protein [Deltaproteobacteria bacterium]|nr:helix-turn-helix domain-containing protein [Deltaproteobacteria bacterium]MBW2074152.1 helix-turn-helix domain-containing protein [Deltaproteobacteria bacterium]